MHSGDDFKERLFIVMLFAIMVSVFSLFFAVHNTLQDVEEQGKTDETTVADVIRMTIEKGDL